MFEITNVKKTPIQLIIKTNPKKGKNFTVLNIPGIGANQNVKFVEDERYTNYIDKAIEKGLIKVKKINQVNI
jgi:hypothetical protein